jgi:L-lactate dehydrogenase (cytochrome)
VQRVADILAREVARTLQLLGVPSVAELTPDRVRLRGDAGRVGQDGLPAVAARP